MTKDEKKMKATQNRMEEEKDSGGSYGWECSVCGYVERDFPEGLPDDYRCPVCGAKPKKFKRVRVG